MHHIAVSNQKGGVGKTCISVNLAGTLVYAGYRVLLVDLDKLGASTQWLDMDEHHKAVYDVMLEGRSISEAAAPTRVEGLFILGGGDYTDAAQKQLASELDAPFLLRERLEGEDAWDYVIFDCPPNFEMMTINALVAAQYLLVPVALEPLAAVGFNQTLKIYRQVRKHHNPSLTLLGGLPNKLDRRKRWPERTLAEFRDTAGDLCMRTVIRENTAIGDSFKYRQLVQEYAPRSTGVEDFKALAAELHERVY